MGNGGAERTTEQREFARLLFVYGDFAGDCFRHLFAVNCFSADEFDCCRTVFAVVGDCAVCRI